MVGVLILSIVFGCIQAIVAYLLLAFTPIINLFSNVPIPVLTGIAFGIGMLLSFVCIILVGSRSNTAATFVRDHFGKTLGLMLGATVLVFGLAVGADALYQAGPIHVEKKDTVDVVFVLDYSNSMQWDSQTGSPEVTGVSRQEAMETAFANVVDTMDDGQVIAVIPFTEVVEENNVLDWTEVNSGSRDSIKAKFHNVIVEHYQTDFAVALGRADQMIQKRATQGDHKFGVILLSDGCDPYPWQNATPTILAQGIPVYTMPIGNAADRLVLGEIANVTGGIMLSESSSADEIFSGMSQFLKDVADVEDSLFPQTLMSPRYTEKKYFMNPTILRILLLLIVGLVFRLITNICIGDNDSSIVSHFVKSLILAAIGACVIEFGYLILPPTALTVILLNAVYWLLMMIQVVKE